MIVDANGHVLIKNVVINFPYLFNRSVFDGQEGKYSAKFLIDKDEQVKTISELEKLIAEKTEKELKMPRIPPEKCCLRDGDYTGRAEDEGNCVLSASSNSRPKVFDPHLKLVESSDDLHIKSGDYVNVKFSLWSQNNNWGKRINAELIAVQFAKSGDALSSSYVSAGMAAEGFDVLEDDDEDFLAAG